MKIFYCSSGRKRLAPPAFMRKKDFNSIEFLEKDEMGESDVCIFNLKSEDVLTWFYLEKVLRLKKTTLLLVSLELPKHILDLVEGNNNIHLLVVFYKKGEKLRIQKYVEDFLKDYSKKIRFDLRISSHSKRIISNYAKRNSITQNKAVVMLLENYIYKYREKRGLGAHRFPDDSSD